MTIWIVVSLPLGEEDRILVEQGSTVFCGAAVGGADVNVTSNVGSASRVFVEEGVSVGVSVGGSGVAVGMAACVCAISVNAAAAAVFCRSTGLTVGATGVALHALTSTTIERKIESR